MLKSFYDFFYSHIIFWMYFESLKIILNRNFSDETHIDLRVSMPNHIIGPRTIYSKVFRDAKTR